MSEKLICKRCSKPILGIIKIATSRKNLGKNSVYQANYYDEECFFTYNQEKALNEFQKERADKKNNKR